MIIDEDYVGRRAIGIEVQWKGRGGSWTVESIPEEEGTVDREEYHHTLKPRKVA